MMFRKSYSAWVLVILFLQFQSFSAAALCGQTETYLCDEQLGQIKIIVKDAKDKTLLQHGAILRNGMFFSLVPMAKPIEISSGLSSFEVYADNYNPFRQQVSVLGYGQLTQVQIELQPKTPLWKKWWFWTAIGGAVVVTGVSLGVGLHYGLKEKPNSNIDRVWSFLSEPR